MKHTAFSLTASAALATSLTLSCAQAATTDTAFSFSVNNQSIFGPGQGAGFNVGGPISLPGATANIGGSANSGTVDALVRQTVRTDFDDSVALSTSGNVAVNLRTAAVQSNRASFETRIGADAQANIDPDSFLGINIGPIGLNEDYTIATDRQINSTPGITFPSFLGIPPIPAVNINVLNRTLSDSGSVALGGPSIPSIPVGVTLEAGIDLEARQSSSLRINGLSGLVRATHSSGATRTESFSLTSSDAVSLDLGLVGNWALDLLGVTLGNRFTTAFGLGGTAFFGIGVGVFCGDTSTDEDNFACTETYSEASTPSLNFINFDNPLNFATRSASLGTITVFDDTPAAVPLPAGLPLLLASFGGFALLRRRKPA